MIYHYYGDVVRRLFLAAAFVMTLTLPFVSSFLDLQQPLAISLIAIPLLVLLAGFISPRQMWLVALDVLAAFAGTLIFEYYAVAAFEMPGATFPFFANQILAIIFIFAVYYSVKTLRGRRHQKELSDMD